jgi:hypothetical protein
MVNELGTLKSKLERCKAMNACLLLSLLSILFPLLFVHAAEDKSSWQVEWGKTVQLAKKEGQLVNYGGEEIIHPEILKAFNKDYPDIKVTTAGGHGSELGYWRSGGPANILSISMPEARPRRTELFI